MHEYRSLSFAAGAAIIASLSTGCNAATTTATAPVESESSSGIELHVSTAGGMDSIQLEIERISCSGEAIEPFATIETIPLAGNGVTNLLVELAPGCYRVVTAPSKECATAESNIVSVLEGMTTEMGLSFQ